MAAPRTKSSHPRGSSQFFVECDERPGSLYKNLLKKTSFSAPQGLMVLSIRVLRKPGLRRRAATPRSKKTAGS
jgi:hypothetical protein